MTLEKIIKDHHKYIDNNISDEDILNFIDKMNLKLFKVADLYCRRKFASLNVLYTSYDIDFEEFRTGFSKQIQNTFEGHLTEFIFMIYELKFLLKCTDFYETIDEPISDLKDINDEFIYIVEQLNLLKGLLDNKNELILQLSSILNRVFQICKIQNIGIKTHLRLNLLYNNYYL